nr:PREDICTED: nose resistant to fluoxetine protein 6-like isoform X3 [Tribolium castaneum]|eukprot:XP_008192486.2 PREDICTED: nose resistant to fluoxetine protein 6-like isoform X3 [Tribolium castaneum]
MWQTTLILILSTQILCSQGKKHAFVETIRKAAVSPKCHLQYRQLFKNFSFDPNSAALQMIDATAKVPSGILYLNLEVLGDFEECINIRTQTAKAGVILGKYCLGRIIIKNDTEAMSLLEAGPEGRFFTSKMIVVKVPTWALCLPNKCTADDAGIIGNALINTDTLIEDTGIAVEFMEPLCQTVNEAYPDLTTKAIITITVLVLLFGIVFLSTIYDLYCIFYGKKSCPKLIEGFSIYTNGQKIFRMVAPTADHLPCLNGLRCISMLWVVYSHQYQFEINNIIAHSKDIIDWANSLQSMILVGGSYSVDTFLTIGGVLMSYGFMKAKTKKIQFNLFFYYLHRYLRLTLPLAVIVLIQTNLYKYLVSGPSVPIVTEIFQKHCEDHWWSALLYVQNYFHVSNMCIPQTWYLCIDMQLYAISPIIFFLLWKHPKVCITLLCGISVAITAASFYVAWQNQLTALLSNFYGNFREYLHKYYFLTHLRATPWIIGIILGYYLFKIKQNNTQVKMSKTVVGLMWVVCTAIINVCVFGGHNTLRSPDYDKWGNALHIALVRPVWALAISWIVFACTINYGGPINWILSLPIYQVINRFTYGIYLGHVIFLSVYVGNRKYPGYFSTFNMLYEFWGTLCFGVVFAVVLVFTTEYPIAALEKYLLDGFCVIRKSAKLQITQPQEKHKN